MGPGSMTKAIAVDIASLGLNIYVHEWNPGHLSTQMSDHTGMDPAVSAHWATEICARDFERNESLIFVENEIWQPPKRTRDLIKDKIFFWRA